MALFWSTDVYLISFLFHLGQQLDYGALHKPLTTPLSFSALNNVQSEMVHQDEDGALKNDIARRQLTSNCCCQSLLSTHSSLIPRRNLWQTKDRGWKFGSSPPVIKPLNWCWSWIIVHRDNFPEWSHSELLLLKLLAQPFRSICTMMNRCSSYECTCVFLHAIHHWETCWEEQWRVEVENSE